MQSVASLETENILQLLQSLKSKFLLRHVTSNVF